MKIPKEFQICGHTVTVEFTDNLVDETECVGRALIKENKIILQRDNRRTRSQIEATFCHEALHFILCVSGYEDERRNEKFVEIVSNLLHQVFSTAVYDDEED